MFLNRRRLLISGSAAFVLAGAKSAAALTEEEARRLVETTIEDMRGLLRQGGTTADRAKSLRKIMELRANLPLIARYCAGRTWRDMSEAQRVRYVEVFSEYISRLYARRFDDFRDDPKFSIGRTYDAGRKGMLIQSPIELGDGKTHVVEWLVSDRGGRVEVIDLRIEGISLADTQKEEIGIMLDKSGGDVEALITHLSTKT